MRSVTRASGNPTATSTLRAPGRRYPKIKSGTLLAERYRLEAELGRGAVGVVYRAYDAATRTRVAVKVLRPEIAQGTSWWGPLGREVRHAREVQHPNVCRIFELAEADGFTFFTMELATRGALRRTLTAGRRRTLADRLADARGVAAGLAAIHAAGLMHRDLKPENVLRLQDGRLVVSDFGLAELATGGPRSAGVGTPGYIAPEMTRGDQPSMAADVWSLGILLHEILFACRPNRAGGARPRGAQAQALRDLCLACAGADPASRPADGREVLRRLDELDGETLDHLLARRELPPAGALTLAARLLETLAGSAGGLVTAARVFVPRRPDLPPRLLAAAPDRRSAVDQAAYTSPERARGQDHPDAGADVFAVGCILHECLTGEPPEGGLPSLHIRARRALDCRPDLSAVQAAAGAPVASLLRRMLDPKPARRPDATACASTLRAQAAAGPASVTKRAPAGALSAERKVCPAVTVLLPGGGRGGDGSVRRLQRAARVFQKRFVRRRPGQWVLAFADAATPGDAAVEAARCALLVRDSVSAAAIAVTTGSYRVGSARGAPTAGASASFLDGVAPAVVRIDEPTARLLGRRFEFADEPAAVLVRELVSDERPRTVLGQEPPCLGRDREIENLLALWDEVAGESVARAVLVTGPAGCGKTRLRHEVVARLAARDPRPHLLIGRGDAMRAGAPFSVLGPALRGAAGLAGGEPPDVQRSRLLAKVAEGMAPPQAAEVAAFLGEIADIPFPEDDLPALAAARQDPRLMADHTLSAWLDFVEAECAAHPLMLVFEDLHWADVPSVAYVDAALRTLRHRPLLVLALARPEVDDTFPALWAARDLQRVVLAPLTPRSARLLVQHICDRLSAGEVEQIVAGADGNPFHLEELVRAAAGPSVPGERTPTTVIGMLQARFEPLGAELKRLLRAAAIFGSEFRAAGLRAILGGHLRNVDHGLDFLVEKEIVYSRQGTLPRAYAFRHALLADAAYAMVAEEDRALGHRLAASYLEGEGEREAIVLVEHHERGGNRLEAARWCKVAAEQALEANDLHAVIDRAERGVGLGAAGDTLGALRAAQARSRLWLGDLPAAELAAREATGLVPGPARLRVIGDLITGLGLQARFNEVPAWVDVVLQQPLEPSSLGARLECLAMAASSVLPGGLYKLAESLYGEIEANAAALEPAGRVRLDAARGLQALHDGNSAAARERFQSAARVAEAIGDLRYLTEMQGDLAIAEADLGLLEEAEVKLRACIAAADRMQLHIIALSTAMNLIEVLGLLGRFDEAHDLGRDVVVLARKHGDRRSEGIMRIALSRIGLWQCRFDLAEEHAREAIERLQASPATLPCALGCLAEARLRQGHAQEALALAQDALRRLEQLGAVDGDEAAVRLIQVECLLATGDRDEARRAARTAWERLMRRAASIDNPSWRAAFLSRWPFRAKTLALARELGVAE